MGFIENARGPADTVAIGSIATAIFANLPMILGVVAGIMGIAWYCVLFYDRFYAKGEAADKEEGA